jgi:hypothetical protein
MEPARELELEFKGLAYPPEEYSSLYFLASSFARDISLESLWRLTLSSNSFATLWLLEYRLESGSTLPYEESL